MRQMRFFNREKDNQISQALSDNINSRVRGNNYNVNNTGVLYGAINKTASGGNEEPQKKDNPSLSGMVGTAKQIGSYFGGGEGGEGGGESGMSSVPWGTVVSVAKGGYDTIMSKKDENGYDDYSDVEETIIYPLYGAGKGASMGGGWGALGGALYGLGYSFKDDLGLEDNEWYTDLIFPIGLGDEHEGLGLSL